MSLVETSAQLRNLSMELTEYMTKEVSALFLARLDDIHARVQSGVNADVPYNHVHQTYESAYELAEREADYFILKERVDAIMTPGERSYRTDAEDISEFIEEEVLIDMARMEFQKMLDRIGQSSVEAV